MSAHTWTLTDSDRHQFVESIRITPETLGLPEAGWSVTKNVLRGGPCDGVDVIEVHNGRFRFTVVPTRGMGIRDAWLGEYRLGWKSPVHGPVHPQWVRLDQPDGLGWLGGFDELVVRCGLEYNGGPEFNPNGTLRYGLHGRIANTPAHKVEVSIDPELRRITVTGMVDEARVLGQKLRLVSSVSTQFEQLGFAIHDRVLNFSAEPSELELIYHTNLGPPLLGPGSRLLLPARKIVPLDRVALENLDAWNCYGPGRAGSKEVCILFDLAAADDGTTMAVVRSAAGDRAVRCRFNRRQLPWFTLWKNCQAAADGYVTGLEPATNLPNTKSFEKQHGRVLTLGAGQFRDFDLALDLLADSASVAAAERDIARLQGDRPPELVPRLLPDWSGG